MGIQMTEVGPADVLRYVRLPDPVPGPGEIVIRVDSAAVNFLDVMRRRGHMLPQPLPFTPGMEVAGTVASVGAEVSGLECGLQVFGTVGPYGNGGYADLAVATASNVMAMPRGLEFEVAAGLLAIGLTATLMLTEAARLSAGESIFIPAAAGGVGSYTVQIAKALGAAPIIAGASTPDKRQIALDAGADHAIDYRQADWPDRVKELTGGRGVDVALEMVGPQHLPSTLTALAPFGRLINYGSAGGRDGHVDGSAMTPLLYDPAPSQSLQGFNLNVWMAQRPKVALAGVARLLEWIADGSVTGPPIHTLPLSQAAQAHRLLESGTSVGKLILKP